MSAQTQSSAKKRTVHQLDTPYSTIQWPEISQDDQNALLELLCSLLNPIGQHRAAHIKPSKGKKARKDEQRAKSSKAESDADSMDTSPPPPPDLVHHVDIGLNAITQNLQVDHKIDELRQKDKVAAPKPRKQYAVVFVARGDQSAVFNCHFPKMVAAASKDLPDQEKIRLVGFSKSCSERLSSCLGIPRVSSVGISRDATGAKGLLDMVARVVEPVEAPWLDEENRAKYLGTNINSVETSVGEKRQKATLS